MSDFFKKLFGGSDANEAAVADPSRPHPIHVGDADFESTILKADKLAIVDFWADWCGPCHMIAPTIENLAVEYDGRVVVAKLDVDDNQRTAARYNVRSIPTVLFLKDGKEVDRMIGVQSYTAFAARVERYLESA